MHVHRLNQRQLCYVCVHWGQIPIFSSAAYWGTCMVSDYMAVGKGMAFPRSARAGVGVFCGCDVDCVAAGDLV